ncbi:MAG: PIN domain-containing protein [Candidatus Woesearchaeota archaeon]
MNKFLLDTSAWLEYAYGTFEGEKVRKIFSDRESEILTFSFVVGELVSKLSRDGIDPEEVFSEVSLCSHVAEIDLNLVKDAGKFHAEMRKKISNFSLVDAYVWIIAKRTGATIVTKDTHFKEYKPVILLK